MNGRIPGAPRPAGADIPALRHRALILPQNQRGPPLCATGHSHGTDSRPRSIEVPEHARGDLAATDASAPGAGNHAFAAHADLRRNGHFDSRPDSVGRSIGDPAATGGAVDQHIVTEEAAKLTQEQSIKAVEPAAIPERIALELDAGHQRVGHRKVGADDDTDHAAAPRSGESPEAGGAADIEALEVEQRAVVDLVGRHQQIGCLCAGRHQGCGGDAEQHALGEGHRESPGR